MLLPRNAQRPNRRVMSLRKRRRNKTSDYQSIASSKQMRYHEQLTKGSPSTASYQCYRRMNNAEQ
jgi:hypothetical protein